MKEYDFHEMRSMLFGGGVQDVQFAGREPWLEPSPTHHIALMRALELTLQALPSGLRRQSRRCACPVLGITLSPGGDLRRPTNERTGSLHSAQHTSLK
jgi:hypothetical protein